MKVRTCVPFFTKDMRRALMSAETLLRSGITELCRRGRALVRAVDNAFRTRKARGANVRKAAPYLPPIIRIDGVVHRNFASGYIRPVA